MQFKYATALTFAEVLSEILGYSLTDYLAFPFGEEDFLKAIQKVYNLQDSWEYDHFNYIEYDTLTSEYKVKDVCVEMLNIVFDRFRDSYCVFIDKEEDLTKETFKFINNFSNILRLSFNYYSTLLNAYASKENALLDKISSSSIVRFNDTPQDEGDFANDEHTTSINQSEALTDLNSPIMRLKEIQDSYKNLVEDWSNEFKKLFREEIAL